MPVISQQQLEQIKKNAPFPDRIEEDLALKGYSVEGKTPLNQAIGDTGGQKVSFNTGEGTVSDIRTGIIKSIGETLKGASSIGEKYIVKPLVTSLGLGKGVFGDKTGAEQLQSQIEKANNIQEGTLLQPTNLAQKVGKVGADVAQFFIPGGAEKSAIKSIDAIIDSSKLVSEFGSKAGLVKNLLKAVSTGGVMGVSNAGVTALQGGNTSEVKTAGVVGGVLGTTGKILSSFAPELVQSLAKSSFKLTPQAESKIAPKIEGAAKFVQENGLSLNPAKQYKQVSLINDRMEKALQSAVGGKISVPTNVLKAEISKIPNKFLDEPAIYQEVKRDVAKILKTLQQTKGRKISLYELLSGKRSFGKSAFGKSSTMVKMPGVVSEGDYAIEQAYQNVLENAIKNEKGGITIPKELKGVFNNKKIVSLQEFNKRYSQAINTKKFSSVSKFKKDTQLVGRLFGLWAGESLGQVVAPGLVGKIVGGATGEVLSGKLPGIVRGVAGGVLRNSSSLPTTSKVISGISGKSNQ